MLEGDAEGSGGEQGPHPVLSHPTQVLVAPNCALLSMDLWEVSWCEWDLLRGASAWSGSLKRAWMLTQMETRSPWLIRDPFFLHPLGGDAGN